MDANRYEALMAVARTTNAKRDVTGLPLDVRLERAMGIIQGGIESRSWHAVAEGQAMWDLALLSQRGGT